MSALEKIFGHTAQMTVLQNLITHKNESTYLSGIAEETGLSHSSVARVIEPLLKADIVIERRLGKQIRTFRLNMDNNITTMILDFYIKLNEEFNTLSTDVALHSKSILEYILKFGIGSISIIQRSSQNKGICFIGYLLHQNRSVFA